MLPTCYIRLDVSHLINMVAKWKCLKGKDKTLVRAFNLRCISQVYQMDTFAEIKYVMKSLLSVALSKTIGCTTEGKSLTSDVRMQYLNNMIKGNIDVKIETVINNDIDDVNQEVEYPINDYETNADATNWINWSNSILDSAKQIAKESEYGSIINA
ncbi:unnamed protein product [Lasius platythorax]|uniref:Uncharacterized protein n=1 Tax=Lasius platythorax TaxID=488582 RepID=A0AAV2MYZ6_9HYME